MNKEKMQDPILKKLQDPRTIRLQAQRIFDLAQQNQSEHFILDLEAMTSTASFVVDVIHDHYSDLNIPYHSRWRHFETGSIDRISAMKKILSPISSEEWGKVLYELVILSVFLDAGAGSSWRYQEKGTYSRSEGLALASLDWYQSGAFSLDTKNPLQIDAQALLNLTPEHIMQAFQVTTHNPLEGLEGRLTLLHQLGAIIKNQSSYFGTEGRLGNFYSYIHSLIAQRSLSAGTLFQNVLNAFNDIWPKRVVFHGVNLGDVGIHKALKNSTPGSEYVPFHKLSQWLTYSLIEPLEQTGIKIMDLEQLTGLPEYRNGGLFIDTGVIQVRNKTLLSKAQDPNSEAIIEWRALTVCLLDQIAVLIRRQLQMDSHSLPLAKVLQGGTWEAGRRIAKQKRPDGTPPIRIINDGTIF